MPRLTQKSTTAEPQLKISFLFISMPTTAVFNVIPTLKFTITSTAVACAAGTKVAWFTVPVCPGSRQRRPCRVLLGTLRTVATCQTECFMESLLALVLWIPCGPRGACSSSGLSSACYRCALCVGRLGLTKGVCTETESATCVVGFLPLPLIGELDTSLFLLCFVCLIVCVCVCVCVCVRAYVCVCVCVCVKHGNRTSAAGLPLQDILRHRFYSRWKLSPA